MFFCCSFFWLLVSLFLHYEILKKEKERNFDAANFLDTRGDEKQISKLEEPKLYLFFYSFRMRVKLVAQKTPYSSYPKQEDTQSWTTESKRSYQKKCCSMRYMCRAESWPLRGVSYFGCPQLSLSHYPNAKVFGKLTDQGGSSPVFARFVRNATLITPPTFPTHT